MTEVVHRTRGHAKKRLRAEQRRNVDALLALPCAQPIIKRIGENVDPDYPGRADHIAAVAAVVIRAKFTPSNAYAKPSLP